MFANIRILCLLFLLCAGLVRTVESQTHFVFVENTGNNATIAIPISASPNIAGVPIAVGDEIGVFTPSGLCVGAIVWNGNNGAVTCWGDNDQTVENDGMGVGERILYRLWQRSSGYEFKSINVSYSEGDTLYRRNGIYVLTSLIIEGTVTIEASCLTPNCLPDSIAAMASFSFCQIIGSPTIETITIHRSGSACDADVPKARLYRDINRNNVIDAGDIQLDTSHSFTDGNTCFDDLDYSPTASENLLVVFEISTDAVLTNTTSASIDSNDVTGGTGTDIIFHGVTTPSYPLHLGIIEFAAVVKGNNVTLMWKNASEVNTYGFVVQRTSLNATIPSLWNDVVFVERVNASSAFQQYSYVDAHLANGRYGYRLKHIDRDGKFYYSEIIEAQILPPNKFTLEQNYPNPFNPTTTIEYQIPLNPPLQRGNDALASRGIYVTLKIFDLLGREVATLVNEEQSAGWKEVVWNARQKNGGQATNVSSGIYIYRLQAENFVEIRKMMLIK
ncbi:MAG: T9SS type A sorting domain-containing protein [Bacteroidota bacterium]|nr:T9SS type A sorting domain-containing protein [Bacteroidota bacterium]